MRSLIHVHAWDGATRVVGVIRHLLREEEIIDAHGEFYQLLGDVLEGYGRALTQTQARLAPLGESHHTTE